MAKKNKLYLYSGAALLAIAGISAMNTRVETVDEIRYEEIACGHTEQKSAELEAGAIEITQECKNGKRKITEKVTYKNGSVDKRQTVSTEVEEPAVDEIKLIGTKQPDAEPQTAAPTTNAAQAPAQSQPTTNQNIDYSNEKQYGYCKDGTPVYGNPHAVGRANVCYGHKGWVGN